MAQITGIGANVFDTLYRLDAFPAEDTKQGALSVTEAGGGPCGTGLAAAARLGAGCAYLGCCSDDGAGRFLVEDFRRRGVDTGLMTPVAGTLAFRSCIWLSDAGASRTCVFHRGTVPPTPMDRDRLEAIARSDILLVDGNDLDAAVAGAEHARRSGTLVLYDAGGRYPGVERLLALTDILIPSEEFALGHTGCTDAQGAAKALFDTYRPRVVVVTRGKEGGVLYDGDKVTPYPAFPVEAVDTNGAGDVFHGAFAFGLTRSFSYERCCIFASAVSALKCTRVGARDGVPDYGQTVEFLRRRGVTL